MNRKFGALILTALALAATGCEKAKRVSAPPAMMQVSGLAESGSGLAMSVRAYADSSQRFIAESHKLEMITAESELQKSWESVVAFCGTIRCEVISSTITTRTGDTMPSGSVALRVVPEDLKKLLERIQTLGKIAQHTTEREDKTAVVVDTEAKIKNLTSFRDNLRAMLGKPSATVKDLVEIERQLTETQSELDSQTAQRKILANETEKIAVEISLRVERPSGNAGGFGLIWNALRESGSVLGDSTASLIYTIVAIIPWLILILPGCWLLLRLWRKLRRRRGVTPPPAPATI